MLVSRYSHNAIAWETTTAKEKPPVLIGGFVSLSCRPLQEGLGRAAATASPSRLQDSPHSELSRTYFLLSLTR